MDTRREFLTRAMLLGGVALTGIEAAPPDRPEGRRTKEMQETRTEGMLDSQKFRHAVIQGDLEAVTRYLDQDSALMYSRNEQGQSVFLLA